MSNDFARKKNRFIYKLTCITYVHYYMNGLWSNDFTAVARFVLWPTRVLQHGHATVFACQQNLFVRVRGLFVYLIDLRHLLALLHGPPLFFPSSLLFKINACRNNTRLCLDMYRNLHTERRRGGGSDSNTPE